jgi:molybdopterin-guanine dinucleotide biosynthesis protein A
MTRPHPLARTCGLLLAGGQSRRFGAEKAVARFGGATMMDAVISRFEPIQRIGVSARVECAAAAHASALGLDVVHDPCGSPAGPLAGVLAGLAWADRNGFDMLATAPCDAPLLPHGLFEVLLAAIDATPAAFVVTRHGEHPLCAVWRTRLREPLRRALTGGRHPSVRAFLTAVHAKRIPFPDPTAFANANTPEALAVLGRLS